MGKDGVADIAGSVGATEAASNLEELVTQTTVGAKRLIRNPHVAILRGCCLYEVMDLEVPPLSG